MTQTSTQPDNDAVLSRLVVDRGLASQEELDRSLASRLHSDSGQATPLGKWLVQQRVITPGQLDRLQGQVEQASHNQQIPGYQLQEKLGAGSYGKVFKARQLSLDRTVAIKVLNKKFSSDPKFVESLYAEGRAAAKLNHPHIVAALDVGQAGEFHYFVMEYVEGRSAYDLLQEMVRLEEDEAMRIVLGVAKALDHAHRQHIIHRDVKPQNIMLTREGLSKLADMGLARATDDQKVAEAEKGKAIGSPYFISPEQIRGERDIDARADIYSLGATFYYLLAGQPPFEAQTPQGVMQMHLKAPLVSIDKVNPRVSQEVAQVIRVCMGKARENRYASTADLVEDLEAIRMGEAPLKAQLKLGKGPLSMTPDTSDSDSTDEDAPPGSAPDHYVRDEEPGVPWMMIFAIAGWGFAVIFAILWLIT